VHTPPWHVPPGQVVPSPAAGKEQVPVAPQTPTWHASGATQSKARVHSTHATPSPWAAQKGVPAPQGEQPAPQKAAESQGEHSAAELQWKPGAQPLLPEVFAYWRLHWTH